MPTADSITKNLDTLGSLKISMVNPIKQTTIVVYASRVILTKKLPLLVKLVKIVI